MCSSEFRLVEQKGSHGIGEAVPCPKLPVPGALSSYEIFADSFFLQKACPRRGSEVQGTWISQTYVGFFFFFIMMSVGEASTILIS